MLNLGYVAQRLRRPLPTKDGGTLHTVADAANYIVALPDERRRSHWDRGAHPLGFSGRIRISCQLELALFYDRSSISKCRHAETSTYAWNHQAEIAAHRFQADTTLKARTNG